MLIFTFPNVAPHNIFVNTLNHKEIIKSDFYVIILNMKTLIIIQGAPGEKYITRAFIECGISTMQLENTGCDFSLAVKDSRPDLVFSMGFIPSISNRCETYGIPYAAWAVSFPDMRLFSSQIMNPHSNLFISDYRIFCRLHNMGLRNIHFLPPGFDIEDTRVFVSKRRMEISFAGRMYSNAGDQLYDSSVSLLDPFTNGYIKGILKAQETAPDRDIIYDSLSAEIIESLCHNCPVPNPFGISDMRYIYSEYMLRRKILASRRRHLLSSAALSHEVRIFTDDSLRIKGIQHSALPDYYRILPDIYYSSDINLLIMPESFQEAYNIIGSGGFLITDACLDIDGILTEGKDYIRFSSGSEFMQLVEFYLKNPSARDAIIRNGMNKIRRGHTYSNRIHNIMDICLQ